MCQCLMSVDEVEAGTTLPRKRVRHRNAELPEILEDMQSSDDLIAGLPFSLVFDQVIEEPSLQERFRVCTVNQFVGRQHFAEQNIDNSVDVVSSPMQSVAANVDYDAEPTSTAETNKDRTYLLSDGNVITDNLSDEEFAQALVPLNSDISQYLGHLKSMNDQVSPLERTLEETRCKLGLWVLNKGAKLGRRQLSTSYSANATRLWKSKVSCLPSFVSDNACLTTGDYSVLDTARSIHDFPQDVVMLFCPSFTQSERFFKLINSSSDFKL